MNQRFRQTYPARHRLIGKWNVAIVLFAVAPSGLWMSARSYTGVVAGAGFASLAIATGLCAAMGWRMAVRRQFQQHRRWMTRFFLLLCSAIILRLISGLSTVLHADAERSYPLAAWTAWIIPLIVFECVDFQRRRATALIAGRFRSN